MLSFCDVLMPWFGEGWYVVCNLLFRVVDICFESEEPRVSCDNGVWFYWRQEFHRSVKVPCYSGVLSFWCLWFSVFCSCLRELVKVWRWSMVLVLSEKERPLLSSCKSWCVSLHVLKLCTVMSSACCGGTGTKKNQCCYSCWRVNRFDCFRFLDCLLPLAAFPLTFGGWMGNWWVLGLGRGGWRRGRRKLWWKAWVGKDCGSCVGEDSLEC